MSLLFFPLKICKKIGVYFFGIGAVGGGGAGGEDDDEFAGSRRAGGDGGFRLGNSSSSRGGPPLVIDATMKGGRARFVNHSCAPNCFAELVNGSGGCSGGAGGEWGERGVAGGSGSGSKGDDDAGENAATSPSYRPRVLIRAAVDLMPGEEITYDYCLSGEPEAGAGGAAAGRSHDLLHASGGGGSAGGGAGGEAAVRCRCGAPTCRGVL